MYTGLRFLGLFLSFGLIFLLSIYPTITSSSSVWEHQLNTKSDTQSSLHLSASPKIGSFSSNLLISTDDSRYPHHVEPTLAFDHADNIHVGWKNAYSPDGPGIRVSYTSSPDGSRWSFPLDMPSYFSSGSYQSDPWMRYDGSSLYFAYLEVENGTRGMRTEQITMAKYSGGWSYTNATAEEGIADKETFDVGPSGNIYLIYDDVLPLTNKVRLSRSVDAGNSFVDNVTLTAPVAGRPVAPYILATDQVDTLVASWTYFANTTLSFNDLDPSRSDILVSTSTDGGQTWSVPVDVNPLRNGSAFETNPTTGGIARTTIPTMAMAPNSHRVYLAWADPSLGDWDVYLRYSDDHGRSWSERIMVNKQLAGQQWMPDISVDGNDVLHIAYYDLPAGSTEYNLNYVQYDQFNSDFSSPIQVSDDGTPMGFTRPGDYLTLRIDRYNIPHLVWTDGRNGELDIFYASGIPLPTSSTTSSNTVTTSTTSSTNSSTPIPSIPVPIEVEVYIGALLVATLLTRLKKLEIGEKLWK